MDEQTKQLKLFDDAAYARSVVDPEMVEQRRRPISPIILNIAHVADEIEPWGQSVKVRDLQLRNFWPTEPILASATYTMVTKMSTLEWHIVNADPTQRKHVYTINAATALMQRADRGKGWQHFIVKVMTDVYTQDNGAFIEIIRREDNPTSPVVGIAHLDSYRCHRTGDPETPVIYEDRNGREHALKWWNVVTIEDMPSPIESMFDMQLCAVSRCLRAAQILRDIAIFKKEKLSGLNPRALNLVSGISQQEIEDARAWADEQAVNANLYRYQPPYIIPTINPEAALSHVQINLASLPDGYDEEATLRWYITQVAMAFGADYQEFAPLPGGALGSSQQSETLHLKSSGKGLSANIRIIEDALNNNGVLPATVKFKFKVKDAQADSEYATARFTRGKDRVLRVQAGELTPEAAVELAVQDGDLPEHLADQVVAYIGEQTAKREVIESIKLQQLQMALARGEELPEEELEETGGGSTFSAEQVSAGIQSQLTRSYDRKYTAEELDEIRAGWIARMYGTGELEVLMEEINEEVLETQQQRIRQLLGES